MDNSIKDRNVGSGIPDCTNYNPSTYMCSGGWANAYATIADVNAASFSPGDFVLFRRGETWREQLTVPSSGSEGNPITFGAFGRGKDPIISGADVLSSFTPETVGTGSNLTADPNLQAYWDLEEPAGGTRIDGTGHGNDLASTNNVGHSSDHVQGSYSASFVRTDSQVLSLSDSSLSSGFVGKSGTTNTALTIGFWVKFTSISGDDSILDKGNLGSSPAYVFYIKSSKINFVATLDGVEQTIATDSIVSPGIWYHVTGRIDPATKTVSLFLNGVEQSATYTATRTAIATNGSPLRIGDQVGYGYLDSLLDEVFVFNRALTDEEIQGVVGSSLAGGSGFTAYYASNVKALPNQAFEDGARLVPTTAKIGLTPGHFWYDPADQRLYVRMSGDDNPSGHTVEASQRNLAASVTGKNYLTFNRLDFSMGNLEGLSLTDSNATVVENSTFTLSYEDGLSVYSPSGVNNSLVITRNTADFNGASGFSIFRISNSVISQNTVRNNCQLYVATDSAQATCAGIRSGSLTTTENIFEENVVRANGYVGSSLVNPSNSSTGAGIWLDTTGASNTVRYNLAVGNASVGIFNEDSNGNCYLYNVAANNSGTNGAMGIAVGRGSQNNLVYSNTAYGNRVGIAASSDFGASGVFQNNVFEDNIAFGNTVVQFMANGGGENDGTNGTLTP
ncbi:MAG: right-handed parallel beta-helix repeat-containing protein [Acidobacteriota bacterium]